ARGHAGRPGRRPRLPAGGTRRPGGRPARRGCAVSLPLWVAELTGAFWSEAGEEAPFPRNLCRPIARALPVAVVSLPRLRLGGVRAWLRDNGLADPCRETDRPLRACLAAQAGHGLIFVDGSDRHDEQRFSLAHELGHFLRHYRQ